MEEFLKNIGINGHLYKGAQSYVLPINSSDDFGVIYSKLENSDLVEEDSESSQVTIDYSSIQYVSDEYIIQLIADFENDEYRLTIKEN